MPTSITKAQAKLLADGFLDNIGDDELKPTESLSALILLAGGMVEQAQSNLNNNTPNRVSTGALSDSITIGNPTQTGKTVRMDITALFYYKFIDQGVRGTESGSGKYAFKNNKVSKKMMTAIRKWVIREGLKAKTDVGGPSITKREAKRKTITDTSQSTAYAIAGAVKRKGIQANNFFTDAVITTQNKADDILGAALKIDIINTLPDGLNSK
jgi:hypothetical protein